MAASSCALAVIHGGIMRIMEAATLAQATTGDAVDVASILQSVPKELNCSACGSTVKEVRGRFEAPGCTSTGSCELSWADMHDADYRDASGRPKVKRVPCGGFTCAAVVILSDEPGGKPDLDGTCTVDTKGEEWRKSAMNILNSMQPVRPEDGFEVYDGDPSYVPPAE
jgi:hypothetical protein